MNEFFPFMELIVDMRHEVVRHIDQSTYRSLALTCTELSRSYSGPVLKGTTWIIAAVDDGNAALSEWIYLQRNSVPFEKLLSGAIGRLGNLRLFDFVTSRISKFALSNHISAVARKAALHGHLHLLEHLQAHHSAHFSVNKCMPHAARGNHVPILKYFSRTFTVNAWATSHTAGSAAAGGAIEALEWLIKEPAVVLDAHVFSKAANNGHLACLEWLLPNLRAGLRDVHAICASSGRVELLHWIHNKRIRGEKPPYIIRSALYSGSVSCVKYAVDVIGAALPPGALDIVCQIKKPRLHGGETLADLVKYLLDSGIRPLPYIMKHFSSLGEARCVRMLYENGVGIYSDERVYVAAISSLSLELLEWLNENDIYFDDEEARQCYEEVVVLMGRPQDKSTQVPPVLKWLRARSPNIMPKDFCQRSRQFGASGELLRYLHTLEVESGQSASPDELH